MSSFLLDEDGDLDTTGNELTLTTGADAVRQHLQVKFNIFLGEWEFDTTVGFPWFRDVLIKNPSFVVVQAIVKNEILNTPGVLELTKFDFPTPSARAASLTFAALTDDGPIDYSIPIDISGGT